MALVPRRGNFLLFFALALVPVLGFGAIAIDVGYLRKSQMELQNATDAAAHAALLRYRDDLEDEDAAREAAKLLAASNRVAGEPLHLADTDIVFGQWDFEARVFQAGQRPSNAVHVTGRRGEASTDGPIDYFLGPVLGVDHGEAVSSATGAFRYREMMLVFDTTGSFFRDIDNGRDAALAFLTQVDAYEFPHDQIGLVAFAQSAKVYTPLQNVHENASAIYDAWYGDGDVTVTCVRFNGTANCTYVPNHQAGLNICFKDKDGDGVVNAGVAEPFNQRWFDAGKTVLNLNCYDGTAYPTNRQEGTYHAVALSAAIDNLLDEGIPGNMKIIVLVSDGRAQCAQPDTASTASCVAARQQEAYDQVDRAAENDISIFSVMLCSNCNPTQMASYEAFASALKSGVGKAYLTSDSGQLDDILTEIARSLPIALVE